MADNKTIREIVLGIDTLRQRKRKETEIYNEALSKLNEEIILLRNECKHWQTHLEQSSEGELKVCDVCGFEFPHNDKDKITLE